MFCNAFCVSACSGVRRVGFLPFYFVFHTILITPPAFSFSTRKESNAATPTLTPWPCPGSSPVFHTVTTHVTMETTVDLGSRASLTGNQRSISNVRLVCVCEPTIFTMTQIYQCSRNVVCQLVLDRAIQLQGTRVLLTLPCSLSRQFLTAFFLKKKTFPIK